MTATLTQPTTDVASPALIRITGSEARDIAQHVRAYVRPGRSWSEVQVMRECAYGCKLYVRRQGAVTQYRLIHSATYGCHLGRDKATREVPVSVAPMGVPTAPTVRAAIVAHCLGEDSLFIEARVGLVEAGFDLDLVQAMSPAEVVRFCG